MNESTSTRPGLLRFAPWLWGVLGIVVLGILIISPNNSDASPSPSFSSTPSSSGLDDLAAAADMRDALAAEVAGNTEAEHRAGEDRLDRIEAVLSTSAGRPPPEEDYSTTSTSMTIDHVIDGDTVVSSTGYTIRIVGIDTPEQDMCGYIEATEALRELVDGHTVTVTNPASVDDTDKYGRILRYLDSPAGEDVGTLLIEDGLAVARYDYLDGYGWHPKQYAHRSLDAATEHLCGSEAENDPGHILAITDPVGLIDLPEDPPTAELEPWNLPGPPDLDCSDIGFPVEITGPDYHQLDSDGDGIGCESYG